MDLRRIDPRDTAWEQDHARYRVYFWDIAAVTAYEYEVVGAVDVGEVLGWASGYAGERGWAYTLYVVVDDSGAPGLVRLAGVLGDPFAEA